MLKLIPEGLDKVIEVLPTNLQPYFKAQTRYNFFDNCLKKEICKVCGVNYSKLDEDGLMWVNKNLCSKCEQPYLTYSVTTITGFHYCEMSWYAQNVLGEYPPVTEPMLFGSFVHKVDELINKLLSDNKVYRWLANETSVIKIAQDLTNLVSRELPDKGEKYKDTLETHAFVYAVRIYNDAKSGGQYQKFLTEKWVEKAVIGAYSNNSVNLLIPGHIDKLYKVGENSFFVRDDKSRFKINVHFDDIDYNLQLGGYAFLLKQMYGYDVLRMGSIWWSRYFDFKPVPVDENLFVNLLKRLTKAIYTGEFKKIKNCQFCFRYGRC